MSIIYIKTTYFVADPFSDFAMSESTESAKNIVVLGYRKGMQAYCRVPHIWRYLFLAIIGFRLFAISGIFWRWSPTRWAVVISYCLDVLFMISLTTYIIKDGYGSAMFPIFWLRWMCYLVLPAVVLFLITGFREDSFEGVTGLLYEKNTYQSILQYLIPAVTCCLILALLLLLASTKVLHSGSAQLANHQFLDFGKYLDNASFLLTAWIYIPLPLGVAGSVAYFMRKRWGPHLLMGYYLLLLQLILLAIWGVTNLAFEVSNGFFPLESITTPFKVFITALRGLFPLIGACIILPMALVIASAFINRERIA